MAIDPLARISRDACIGSDVSIGPFSVIEAGAVIGDRCQVSSRVTIKSGVRLGRDNLVEDNTVLGGRPQHLRKIENPGSVVIGDRNVIRENATVHCAMKPDERTIIGNDCLLMVGAHVAHDCTVGDNVVLTNNVLLAGHVQVGDRAYLAGGSAVHQFCRIGRLAMVGGLARVTQDVPPFVLIDGDSTAVVGLNKVGLRRAGLDPEETRQLKAAYQVFYRSGLTFGQRIEVLGKEFLSGPAAEFGEFFLGGTRGFVRERRSPPGATIRPIHEAVIEREQKTGGRVKQAG